MDMFLLVMPAIFFALWQHVGNTYSTEVKSSQENIEKFFGKNLIDEAMLRNDEAMLQDMDDIINEFTPKVFKENMIWGFVIYLTVIAVLYFLKVSLNYYDVLWCKNSQGIDHMITPSSMVLHIICVVCMLGLVGATCHQIWNFSKEKKKFDELYSPVKEYIKRVSSH